MSQGIVLYTDGGVRPRNPGPAGWGIHGYLYNRETPKKGCGNSDVLLTSCGYLLKSEAELAATPFTHVTPVHYVDGYGSFPTDVTNNIAELVATTRGLIYAQDFDIDEIQVFTDSEYVRQGVENRLETWQKNNWVKPDGTEIANIPYWKDLVIIRDILKARGIEVKINWVRGHNDDLGNELADKLATTGLLSSQRFQWGEDIKISVAEGYWKQETNRHPFINLPRMYFNTLPEYNTSGQYYIGNHGKKDEQFGKRRSEGAFGVVVLKEPDKELETIRNFQCKVADGANAIIATRLDFLYRPATHKQVRMHGALAMYQDKASRLDLLCLDAEPLTHEFRPPRLAMKAVEEITSLLSKLRQYNEKHAHLTLTDLTPYFYDTDTKANKKGEIETTTKLKPTFVVGFASLEVEANYASKDEIKHVPITLTLSLDLVDRNALKRLEEKSPKITLITWLEAEDVFRYATVIEAGGDIGIWAAVYSNLRFVI